MNRGVIIAVTLGVAAYIGYQSRYVYGSANGSNEGFDFMGEIQKVADWFGIRSVANLSRVDRSLLANKNVRAMLRVIRAGESSQDESAYRVIVGGKQYFTSFDDHPRVFGVPNSTAAGAYQITKTTWDWIKGPMKLADFSPENQDFAALGLIAYRGALLDVVNGNLEKAIPKLRNEWTSLPGASEVQFMTLDKAKQIFIAYGGNIAGSTFV